MVTESMEVSVQGRCSSGQSSARSKAQPRAIGGSEFCTRKKMAGLSECVWMPGLYRLFTVAEKFDMLVLYGTLNVLSVYCEYILCIHVMLQC